MNMSRPGRDVQYGTGLIDTLVALTLLALSLLGASTSLIRTLAANHAATLQSTAVDLAADLAEDMRMGPAPADEVVLIQNWNRRVATELPIGVPPLEQSAGATRVSMQWWDPAVHRPTTFALEFAGAWPAVTP
jgi:Tfp pilus assembly protein PilV